LFKITYKKVIQKKPELQNSWFAIRVSTFRVVVRILMKSVEMEKKKEARRERMTITIVCEDNTRKHMYIDHIVKNCLGVKDLPMKITLSSKNSGNGLLAREMISTEGVFNFEEVEKERELIETFGMMINTASRQVWVNGEECFLTTKEFDLLVFLAKNPGRVFHKEDLLRKMWGDGMDSDIAIVAVYITRIRKKIESDPKKPEYINTVWGSGYRFRT
jgi:DNA-binding response OmpR family regulator